MIQSAIAGLVSGGAYAALGVCVVVMQRMVGVLNFAQAAIGAFGAFVVFVLYGDGIAYAPAALAGTAAAAGIAALLGLAMSTWFSEAGPRVRSTVAVAMLITLLASGFRAFGDSPRTVPEVLPGVTFTVAGVVITAASVAAIAGSVTIAVALWLFLSRTRTGVRLRALSERPTSAELLGIPARRLTVGVWAASGAVSALAILVIAPSRGGDFLSLSMLIVPALAAALIGLFRSLGATVAGGIGIGLLEGLATQSASIGPYRHALPLLVILAILLWSQRSQVWDAAR